MTKTARRKLLREVKKELDWLFRLEKVYNPEWKFRAYPYSKRRERLVRMYYALKRGV